MRHVSLRLVCALQLVLSVLAVVPLAQAAICGKAGTVYTMGTGSCVGETDTLVNGDNFQDTLTAASCGDTIVLTAGIHYGTRILFVSSGGPQGNAFNAPNKSCAADNYVTVQSSLLAALPESRRINPTTDLANLATLESNHNSPVLWYSVGAGWYKWRGIQFTNTVCVSTPGPCPGSGGVTTAGSAPTLVSVDVNQADSFHDVIYDRVLVRPYEETLDPVPNTVRSASQGFRLDGTNITLMNSWVGGFCCKQSNDGTTIAQSNAVGMVSGLGPWTLTNNMLEAYYSNLFTGGGSGPTVPISTTTLTAATTTTATLTSAAGFAVGDVIRFFYATAFAGLCGCGAGCPNHAAATINTINGNDITFTFFGCDTPATAPDVPGQVARQTTRGQVALNNMTITRNTLHKRAVWSANSGQCKSFWEIKEGSNILFEGNTLTGPIDGVTGTGCGFITAFTRNQNGGNPWAASNHNVFRNNYMPGVGGITHSQTDPYHSSMASIGTTVFTNNLLSNIPRLDFFLVDTSPSSPLSVTHNTVRALTRGMFTASGSPFSGFTLKDNVLLSGTYWVNGDADFPSRTESTNVIINTSGGGAPAYTSADFVVANDAAVGFTNIAGADAGGDYHGYKLTGGTSCTTGNWRNCASDGTDPGVNFALLDTALGLATTSISGAVSIGGKVNVP